MKNLNVEVILTIVLFVAPIVYKFFTVKKVEIPDIIKYTLASLGLPDLFICLYYLIFDPWKAFQMPAASQLLSLGILVSISITIDEIHKYIEEKKNEG